MGYVIRPRRKRFLWIRWTRYEVLSYGQSLGQYDTLEDAEVFLRDYVGDPNWQTAYRP